MYSEILKDFTETAPQQKGETVKLVKHIRGKALIRSVQTHKFPNFRPYTKTFLQNPIVELDDNGKDFILKEAMDFYFWVYMNPNKGYEVSINRQRDVDNDIVETYVHIVILPGFVTDFVSSPQILWWLVSPLGRAAKPAVLHDLMYRVPIEMSLEHIGYLDTPTECIRYLTKDNSDFLFYLSLLIRGVPQWKAKAMQLALRYFGNSNYKARK